MRAYIIAAGLALSVIGNASATVVDSGADAQKYCRAFVEGDDVLVAGACEGMIETTMVFSPNLPADMRACPPAQGSALESAKVFLRYLDKNPGRLNEAGMTLSIESFRDAWPCDDDGTPTASGPKPKKRASKKPKAPATQQPAAQQQAN
jgi:Rap1a immunity proteins